jgi:hypothetical protein
MMKKFKKSITLRNDTRPYGRENFSNLRLQNGEERFFL